MKTQFVFTRLGSRRAGSLCIPLALTCALALFARPAAGALHAVGSPETTHSWSQGFIENGVGNFDRMRITLLSGGPLEIPTQTNFTVGGWTEVQANGTSSIASGPATTTDVTWSINFQGSPSPTAFLFEAFDGTTRVDNAVAVWSGGWSFSSGPAPPWVYDLTQSTWSSTIGSAVSAANPNDVLICSNGTFNETVVLDRALTLDGVYAGLDARGAGRGELETVIASSDPNGSVQVHASHVTVDGLTFASGAVKAVHVNGATPSAAVALLNNIVTDATADGLNLFNASSGTVTQNLVQNCGVSGITAGNDMGTANPSDDVRTNASVTKNNLVNCTYGIAGYQLGSTIASNDVAGTPSGVCGICGQFDGVAVTSNHVAGYTNGAAGYGIAFGGYPNRSDPQNDAVTRNTVNGNVVGVAFDLACGTGMTVHENDLNANVVGVGSQAPAGVDASCNWWGDLLGPRVPTSNPSTGSGLVGNVTYWPWLNGSIAGTPACDQYGPNAVLPVPPPQCLSIVHPTITVPVMFNRADASPARGISVTFQIDPGRLALAHAGLPANSIHAGTWLGAYASTYFAVTDNGGGSYTVDYTILGGTVAGGDCGITTGGQLFTVDLKAAGSDGSASIAVASVIVRDCDNLALAGNPGPPASLTIDRSAPVAIVDLAAQRLTSVAGSPTTTRIRLTWTAAVGTVSLYRAPFGSYPEYDDDGPVALPDPAAAPGGPPWTLLSANATSPYDDAPAGRGYYYYVALVSDGCGNASTASNMTSGTLDYVLGDVAVGSLPTDPANGVDDLDISLLGDHYGQTEALGDFVDPDQYLDVGPTTTGAPDARPHPDDHVDFEDLMIFAMDYGTNAGPAPQFAAIPAAADHDELAFDVPASVTAGQTFTLQVRMRGTGGIKGISLHLGWDGAVAEPLAVQAGPLASACGGVVFSAGPGDVDAAVVGGGRGFSGDDVLATVTFRARASGNPAIGLARMEARDARNQRAELGTSAVTPRVPAVTALAPAAPNPFALHTNLGFSLARPGAVDLSIYSVDGRRVRALVHDTRDAGAYRLVWDGTDDQGHRLAPGVFYARLTTGQERINRAVLLVR